MCCYPFFVCRGQNPVEIYRRMKNMYGEAGLSITTVVEWCTKFKADWDSTKIQDTIRSERLSAFKTDNKWAVDNVLTKVGDTRAPAVQSWLSPCDFKISGSLKKSLEGRWFLLNIAVQQAFYDFFKQQKQEFYQMGIFNFMKQWDMFIAGGLPNRETVIRHLVVTAKIY